MMHAVTWVALFNLLVIACLALRSFFASGEANSQLSSEMRYLQEVSSMQSLSYGIAQDTFALALDPRPREAAEISGAVAKINRDIERLRVAQTRIRGHLGELSQGIGTSYEGMSKEIERNYSVYVLNVMAAALSDDPQDRRTFTNKILQSSELYMSGLRQVADAIKTRGIAGAEEARTESLILQVVAACISAACLFTIMGMLSQRLARECANVSGLAANLEAANMGIREKHDELSAALSNSQRQSVLLEHSSRRFAALFDGLPVGCLTFDDGLDVREWNSMMSTVTLIDAHRALHMPLDTAVSSLTDHIDSIRKTVMEEKSVLSFEFHHRGKTLAARVLPLLSADGAATGGVLTVVDMTSEREAIAALESANERLAGLARTDGLTGLRNHMSFQEELESALSGTVPVSLCLLDVDFFKQFNDSFGHPAGDAVLRQTAAILREAIPQPHVVARYGGEEFALVLIGLAADEVEQLVDAARQRLEKADWEHRQITASFGVAHCLSKSITRKSLIESADAALYAAKAAGRNCICTAEPKAVAA